MGEAMGRAAQRVLALLAVMVLTAGASMGADRDRLEAFLNVTGFDVALESIALSAADAPVMLGMSAEDFGIRWKQITEEVFDTGQMHDMAMDILDKTLSEDLLHHAVGFYASDLGQRLVEVENAAHMETDDEAKRAQGEEIVAGLLEAGSVRLEYLKRMNAAIDSAGNAVRAVQEIQLRFLLAASDAGVIDRRLDEDALRALLKENEAEMRLRMQRSALANSAYTYRGFSDEDVLAYAEALEDGKMQQVYDLMNAIQWEIMANRFEALALKMADLNPGEEL
ncbi:DUF2059 domain-containing protein [Marimonas lutisalis]|uniref:DUF2059 domain-containing protein n=1 Tax=Marimonas lutisalis TaxID=2545756 RepID=UPI0010F81814|nr:DUF2059 domain-containing protein [Marimonas lutisalis]